MRSTDAWTRGGRSSSNRMSRLDFANVIIVLAVVPLACSRQTASTNGETVTVEKRCGESACDGWSADPHLSETPGLADACVRSTRQFSAHCDVAFDAQHAAKADADCKLLAFTHSESAIPWLDCLATAECGASPTACAQASRVFSERFRRAICRRRPAAMRE